MLNIYKSRLGKILLSILLLSIFAVGCVRSPSRGWSGPAVSDNILYVGTIGGEVVAWNIKGISEDELEVEHRWSQALGTPGAGGGFTCAARLSTPMSIYGTPAVGEDKIYVGGYDGNVYSFRIDDGSRGEFATGGAIIGSPIVTDETVFVGSSDGKLYALKPDLSGERWPAFETGDKIWSTPVVADGVVYIGSADHRLYAIDIESGKEIWHFEAQAAILSTPLVVDDTVYIGGCDSKFYAIDVEQEGREAKAKWVFEEAENWFWTQALFYNGEIWVGSLDHKVYAIDAGNGEKIWEFGTQGRVRTPPVLVGEVIVFGSEDGNVYKIDPQGKKGQPLRDLGAPILAPLGSDPEKGVVYVHAQDGSHTLYAIKVETGEPLWSYKTSGEV